MLKYWQKLKQKLTELWTFITETKAEMYKVSWPDWPELKNTTIVVIITSVVFGVYLFLVDLGVSQLLHELFRKLGANQ